MSTPLLAKLKLKLKDRREIPLLNATAWFEPSLAALSDVSVLRERKKSAR